MFSHSVVSKSLQPHGLQHAAFAVLHRLSELIQAHVWLVSDAIQPSDPLLSHSPPAFNLNQHQGLFKWVSCLHQVAIVLELQLQHQSFQWISGLISYRIDWIGFAIQGTLKSLLQHHNLKTSILLCSVFFMVQFSHPYMTTGKTIALTIWTFVDKVMFLLFNILPRFVIAFLSRSKRLLISWLQSPSAVILKPKKRNSVLFPLFSHLFVMKWWDWMPWY